MTPQEYTALGVSALIFMIGLIGSLLPVVPGSLIVWLGILLHKLWLGDASVSWNIVLITAILTIVGQLADVVMGAWGARRFGASWKGALGAFIGAFVGLFLPPPLLWLIVGPIVGAIAGELFAGRSFRDGGKAGFGTVVGGLLAFAIKFGLSVCAIGMFLVSL
jgi:uncharacterized protein YqgC (DUF456 family)